MSVTHYTYLIVQLNMFQTKYKANLDLNVRANIQTLKCSVHRPASQFKILLFHRGYTYILLMQTNNMVSP